MHTDLHSAQHIDIQEEVVVERIDYENPYDFNKMHRHTYFELLLFEKGNGGKQIIDFEEYQITSKSIYLIMPGQVHLMKRLPEENGILIQFSKLFLNQSISALKIDYYFKLLETRSLQLNDEQFEEFQCLFEKMKSIYESNSTLKSCKLVHLVGLIVLEMLELVCTSTKRPQIDNSAYQFLSAVKQHYKTVKTVKAYAKMLNVPMNKLTEKVKIHIGKSPLQVIHETLLIEIKRCLIVEQLSHKEIAYQLNFDSQSSYSRFIKKHTQLSPSALKEQLNQIAQ